MIFRLSQKLNTKIKTGSLPTLPLDDNPLADWSAHVFIAERMQHLLVTNTKSLYSIVTAGKGVTDGRTFVERTLSNLGEFLADDGQPFVFRRFILPADDTVRFARALDRSVTGSMNELVADAKYCLLERGLAPYEVGFELNDIPRSSLKYASAREAFKSLQLE